MGLPQPFEFGKRLQDGQDLDGALANPIWSTTRALTATVGGTRTTSTKIVESVANVATVGAIGAGVTLPVAVPGKVMLVYNNSATDMKVFADDPSTIDGVSGNTGITQQALTVTMYVAQGLRAWTSTKLALYTAPVRDFLSVYSTQTQINTDFGTTQIMTFDQTVAASGISLQSGSQLQVSHTGVYNLQFSAQLDKTDSGLDSAEIWLRKNGTNVDWSNTWLELSGNNAKAVAAWNWVLPLNAGDYLELAWWSADIDLRLYARTAQAAVPGVSPAQPGIPSVIASIQGI